MAQASWGGKTWEISAQRVAGIGSLSSGTSIKTEQSTDVNGSDASNERGREPKEVTFDVTYLAATGTNIRQEIEKWDSLTGNVSTLYVGGRLFGAQYMQLVSVDYTVDMISPTGEFLAATLSFTFREYTNTLAGVKKKSVSESGYDAALYAGPTTQQKAEKKTSYYSFWELNQ